MKGYLLDTAVLACLGAPDGEPRVKTWAEALEEQALHISVLTLAEYDRGIAQLPDDDPRRPLYLFNRDAIAARFRDRILPTSDAVIRRWGLISGRLRRDHGRDPPVLEALLVATALEAHLCYAAKGAEALAVAGAAVLDPWTGFKSLPHD